MIFYSYLIIDIIIFLLTTVAGFLFNGKLKLVRYILWVISGLFFILITIITPLNYYWDLKESKYLIGTYTLDIDSSKYNQVDMHRYDSLKMVVKEDRSLSFNSNTPFFEQKTGKWLNWVDGDMENIDVTFDGLKKYEVYYLKVDNRWIFQSQCLVNGNDGDRIVFRIKK